MQRLLLALCVGVALRPALSASGAVAVYFGGPDSSKLSLAAASGARDDFIAALSGFGVENLESLGGQQNPTLTFGATALTATTGFTNGVFNQFPFSVSGTNFLWDADGANDWLQFSQPVTAFGSYLVQAGDGSSAPPTSTPANTLTFRLENTALASSKDVVVAQLGPDWPFYNVVFVGVTDSEPFDRVSLIESYDHDGLLWDDLIAGHASAGRPGDFNENGVVDGGDLEVWLANFGQTTTTPFKLGDGDGDSDTDGNDLLIWQRHLGGIAQSDAFLAVPEPASLALVLIVFACRGVAARAQV